MSSVTRSGRDLLSALLSAGTYEAAAEALRTTAVPLDGNFVEQLNYTAEQAERRGDHDGAHVRSARWNSRAVALGMHDFSGVSRKCPAAVLIFLGD
jgi:hypothetical protein